MFAFKRVNGNDTSDSEVDIEMDEMALGSDESDGSEMRSRSERSQQDAERNLQRNTVGTENSNGQCTHDHARPFKYSSLKRAMGLRTPR